MTASASGNRRMIMGLFSDGQSAERAYQACVERGYAMGEVNVVMSEDTRKRLISRWQRDHDAVGAEGGGGR